MSAKNVIVIRDVFSAASKNNLNDKSASLLDDTRMKAEIKPTLRDAATQIIASCTINAIVIQVGINFAYSAILVHDLQFSSNSMEKINTNQASWIASLVTIFVPLGSGISGPLMDKFGRKRISFITCVPSIISWILMTVAHSLTEIYAARIIAGIAGGLTTVSLVYTSEISHPQIRPMLLCFNSIFVSFGILLVYGLGAFMDWRNMAIVFLVMNCCIFCLLFFIPESPYWLLCFKNEKSVEKLMNHVEENLKWLNPRESIYKQEYARIKGVCEKKNMQRQPNKTFMHFVEYYRTELSSPAAYKPIIILIIIMLLQQLSGTYAVIFYATSVFYKIGGEFGGGLNEYGASVLFGAVRFGISILTAYLSRHYKRRTLCIFSGLGMAFSMFFSGMYMFLTSSCDEKGDIVEAMASQKWLLLVVVLFYACTSTLGFAVIPWTLIGELLPTSIRGFMGGLIVSFAYLIMFGVTKSFPYVLSTMGIRGIFFFFSCMSLIATSFVYLFLPETLGKSLTEIENYFLQRKPKDKVGITAIAI